MVIFTGLVESKAYILSENLIGIIPNSDTSFRKDILLKPDNIKFLESTVCNICNCSNIKIKFIETLKKPETSDDKFIKKMDSLSKSNDINIDIIE